LYDPFQQEEVVTSDKMEQEEKVTHIEAAQNNYAKSSSDVVAWLENAETVLTPIPPTTVQAGQQQQQVSGWGWDHAGLYFKTA
jgi:hypothetical protein